MSKEIKSDKNKISQEEMGTPVILKTGCSGGGGVVVAGSTREIREIEPSLTKEIDHLRYDLRQARIKINFLFFVVIWMFLTANMNFLVSLFS